MQPIFRVALVTSFIFTSGVHANTVLSDTFDTDVENWSTDDHLVEQSNGQLVVTDNGGAGATRAYTDFDSSVTLAIGEQLTLTAEVIFTSSSAGGVQRALDIALSNGAGTTFYVNRISAGSTTAEPYGEGHYLGTNFSGGENNLLFGVVPIDALANELTIRGDDAPGNGYSHTITFTVARTAASTLVLTTTAELSDGSIRSFTVTDTAAASFTFSRVDVGTFGNSNYDFNLDDVTAVVGAIPEPVVPSITAFSYDEVTQNVTLRFTDSGASTYTVESDADLDFSAGVTEYPLDGSEDTTTYPGEIEFIFTDSTATAAAHFWRVRAE